MGSLIGFLIVIFSVFGGYVLAHGELIVLLQPFEFLIIGGAAFGAFVVANPASTLIGVFKNIPAVFTSSKYKKPLYMDLLGLMYALFNKARKQGLMTLEADVDDPASSELFQQFPKILKEKRAVEFITDYLRLVVSSTMNPHELESLMDVELDSYQEETEQVSSAVNNVSDGLPGFGIVAAVLGVVITMSSIDQPPEVLGGHIAAALVGTFLGILLAYGFVGPMGKYLEHKARDEARFLECIKISLLANVSGYSPQVAVEFGRKAIFTDVRPNFFELEEHIRGLK